MLENDLFLNLFIGKVLLEFYTNNQKKEEEEEEGEGEEENKFGIFLLF